MVQSLLIGVCFCFDQMLGEGSRNVNKGSHQSHLRGRASKAVSPTLPQFLVRVIPVDPLPFPLCQNSLNISTESHYEGKYLLANIYIAPLSILLFSPILPVSHFHLLPLSPDVPNLLRGSCGPPLLPGTMCSSLGVLFVF